jgi:hypothetical protein
MPDFGFWRGCECLSIKDCTKDQTHGVVEPGSLRCPPMMFKHGSNKYMQPFIHWNTTISVSSLGYGSSDYEIIISHVIVKMARQTGDGDSFAIQKCIAVIAHHC